MKAYLIDELSPSDMEQITDFLKKNAIRSNLDHIFWIQIPDYLLSDTQLLHRNCRPHVFAAELGTNWLKMEFFVRSLKKMQCTCPGYCNTKQTNYIISFVHTMITRLGIST